MNNEHRIEEELKSMGSSLAGLSRAMPFVVPPGYFEHFANSSLMSPEHSSARDAMPAWSKSMPYPVPAGYFEALTADIVSAATSGDMLSTLPKRVPFPVPAGYFESLPEQLLNAARSAETVQKKPKLLALTRGYQGSARWAAAAIFILFVGLGGYFTFFNQQPANPERILAAISSNEIHDYLQHTYRLDVDRIVDNNEINNLEIENKDIVQYLNETGWDIVD